MHENAVKFSLDEFITLIRTGEVFGSSASSEFSSLRTSRSSVKREKKISIIRFYNQTKLFCSLVQKQPSPLPAEKTVCFYVPTIAIWKYDKCI